MEKTVKKQRKQITKEILKEHYIEYVLEHGEEPKSVFAFSKALKASEKEFYELYNSFGSLNKAIWADWFKGTVDMIEGDENYHHYSIREKLLAFYFSWVELLKENRSFVLMKVENLEKSDLNPAFLSHLKDVHTSYINDLMLEGKDTNEVMERPFSSRYHQGFWVLFILVLKFWSQDESEDYQKTDAFIEKSVNLGFDLVAKSPIDSMLDFGKFILQNRF